MSEVCSPLSSKPPVKVRALSRQFLRESAAVYFRANPPEEVFDTDYALYRCTETGLEFAWPQQPGTAAYYEWLAKVGGYYPPERWEYGVVTEHLKRAPEASRLSVLDVGGGSGVFASQVVGVGASVTVVDLSKNAIEACRQRSIPALEGNIRDLVDQGVLQREAFDHVSSFHCLEHVPDPVGYVRCLLSLVKRSGSVWVSTPCSPMHFELEWFDPQNHPPHHLTRWIPEAYGKLARLAGAEVEILMPPARSAFRRAMFSVLYLNREGGCPPRSRIGKAFLLLRNCLSVPRHLRAQMRRNRFRGKPMADVIMARFIRSREADPQRLQCQTPP